MKPALAASFVAALLVHSLLLFGFRMQTSPVPLPLSDDTSPTDVNLVEAAPPPPAPSVPAQTPEPPQPQPTPPSPTPPPTPIPDTEFPAPASTPAPILPIPPSRPPPERPSHLTAPHSAPGSASSLAGTASPGASVSARISRAGYLSNPKPEYPEQARQMHEEGVVVLAVQVAPDGRADDVSLTHSSGFPLLDESAIRTVRRWTFEPARSAGIPLSSKVEVPVRFSLSK